MKKCPEKELILKKRYDEETFKKILCQNNFEEKEKLCFEKKRRIHHYFFPSKCLNMQNHND